MIVPPAGLPSDFAAVQPRVAVSLIELPNGTPANMVFLCLALAACALGGALARPAPAAASSPCWKVLLNDWYDGRIDGTYPPGCYRDALAHLPEDVKIYSSAPDDLTLALQRRLHVLNTSQADASRMATPARDRGAFPLPLAVLLVAGLVLVGGGLWAILARPRRHP